MDPEVISYFDHLIMLLCASFPCYIWHMMRACICSMCPFTVIQGGMTVFFFQQMRWDYQPVIPSVGPQHVKWCPMCGGQLAVLQEPWLLYTSHLVGCRIGWSLSAVPWVVIRENTIVEILLNRKCAWMISVFADVSYQTLREGLWCTTPLSCGAAGNWKRRSGERWRREEEVEDESGAAARQGFLGHGTRKWTSLAWPAGAYSQKVWGYTLQRSKSNCLREKKNQINDLFFCIHGKDSRHKSRFHFSAVLF